MSRWWRRRLARIILDQRDMLNGYPKTRHPHSALPVKLAVDFDWVLRHVIKPSAMEDENLSRR